MVSSANWSRVFHVLRLWVPPSVVGAFTGEA